MIAEKDRILRRLKIARGHLRGIILMIGRNEYCINISQQIHAVKGALKKIDCIFLRDYLKTGSDFEDVLKVINSKRKN